MCILIEQNTAPDFFAPTMFDPDPNLDASFLEDSTGDEITEYDEDESGLDNIFYRQKRLSCFAHNLMLAVKAVSKGMGSSPSFGMTFLACSGHRGYTTSERSKEEGFSTNRAGLQKWEGDRITSRTSGRRTDQTSTNKMDLLVLRFRQASESQTVRNKI